MTAGDRILRIDAGHADAGAAHGRARAGPRGWRRGHRGRRARHGWKDNGDLLARSGHLGSEARILEPGGAPPAYGKRKGAGGYLRRCDSKRCDRSSYVVPIVPMAGRSSRNGLPSSAVDGAAPSRPMLREHGRTTTRERRAQPPAAATVHIRSLAGVHASSVRAGCVRGARVRALDRRCVGGAGSAQS